MSSFRAWPLRVSLFIATNLAVLVVFGLVIRVLGVDQALGSSLWVILAMAGIFGFGGSFLSLALSKRMALWSTRAKVIERPRNETERWLLMTVHNLSEAAGIRPPDVAYYDSPTPNAFATGMRRNAALVAVSTGLMAAMDREEVRAVLAHEVAHVANGDMVTMALLQGVLNTFVIAAARVVGVLVDGLLSRGNERRGFGIGYLAVSFVAELVFGVLASVIVMAFSRRREYRADAGSAALVGARAMIGALQALERHAEGPRSDLPQNLAAFGIQGGLFAGLFRTHPPIPKRIEALRRLAAEPIRSSLAAK